MLENYEPRLKRPRTSEEGEDSGESDEDNDTDDHDSESENSEDSSDEDESSSELEDNPTYQDWLEEAKEATGEMWNVKEQKRNLEGKI